MIFQDKEVVLLNGTLINRVVYLDGIMDFFTVGQKEPVHTVTFDNDEKATEVLAQINAQFDSIHLGALRLMTLSGMLPSQKQNPPKNLNSLVMENLSEVNWIPAHRLYKMLDKYGTVPEIETILSDLTINGLVLSRVKDAVFGYQLNKTTAMFNKEFDTDRKEIEIKLKPVGGNSEL